jgi:hypothetical protein
MQSHSVRTCHEDVAVFRKLALAVLIVLSFAVNAEIDARFFETPVTFLPNPVSNLLINPSFLTPLGCAVLVAFQATHIAERSLPLEVVPYLMLFMRLSARSARIAFGNMEGRSVTRTSH